MFFNSQVQVVRSKCSYGFYRSINSCLLADKTESERGRKGAIAHGATFISTTSSHVKVELTIYSTLCLQQNLCMSAYLRFSACMCVHVSWWLEIQEKQQMGHLSTLEVTIILILKHRHNAFFPLICMPHKETTFFGFRDYLCLMFASL